MPGNKNGITSRPFHPGAVSLRAVGVVLVFLSILWIAHQKDSPPEPATLSVYCFSAVEDVMRQDILPAFQARWRDQTGEKLEFVTAFAGSGLIVDRILKEFRPDVAVLSSEIDAFRLSRAGIVPGTIWRGLPHRGVVTRSPLVVLSRRELPLRIARFQDLGGEGVRLIHADPATSGCGIWSLIAVYADFADETDRREKTREAALAIWRNVAEAPPSARAALRAFTEGRGDALIVYEQLVLEADVSERLHAQMVYPVPTVMTENIVVRIPQNVDPGKRDLVDSFVEFLWSAECQSGTSGQDQPRFEGGNSRKSRGTVLESVHPKTLFYQGLPAGESYCIVVVDDDDRIIDTRSAADKGT